MSAPVDLLVIGGGINGAGIARDAAGRGLSVILAERDDLAQHTSSASTKLIHGGLRYLEHYEFGLVRESLIERERLLEAAPHIAWPLRFILPHHKGLRPRWLLRLGLFLYDHIGGRKRLPATRSVRLDAAPLAGVLKSDLTRGFEYSDCWVEDSRMVVLAAMDARERGADIRTRTEVTALRRDGDRWHATLRPEGGVANTLTARAVINAAGPWVDHVAGLSGRTDNQAHVRLVKGSHIVTRRLYEGDHAYILQNADGRIVFAIPYEQDFTLIGTTDVAFDHSEGLPKISEAETDYLIDLINTYLATPISRADVVWTYSGVRPLYDDRAANASKVTRDYVFDLDAPEDGAPILSVYGGKITTFRHLADEAVDDIIAALKLSPRPRWTRTARLPGGDFDWPDFKTEVERLKTDVPHLSHTLATRLARTYGTRASTLLRHPEATGADLGQTFTLGLSEAECRYLVTHEFARTAEDILWRRTKIGLHMSPTERDAFADWFKHWVSTDAQYSSSASSSSA